MGCIMSFIKCFRHKRKSNPEDDIIIVSNEIIKTPINCPQCYCDFNISETIKMKCNHYYCRKCYYDTHLSNILHPDMKICAECLKPLENIINESTQSLVINPIPLDNSLKNTCNELIENLKYFNLIQKDQHVINKILSVSPHVFRLAIFKVVNQTPDKTYISLYLLPEFNSTYIKMFQLIKNNQSLIDEFHNYLFNIISEEYSIWFSDSTSFDVMTKTLNLI